MCLIWALLKLCPICGFVIQNNLELSVTGGIDSTKMTGNQKREGWNKYATRIPSWFQTGDNFSSWLVSCSSEQQETKCHKNIVHSLICKQTHHHAWSPQSHKTAVHVIVILTSAFHELNIRTEKNISWRSNPISLMQLKCQLTWNKFMSYYLDGKHPGSDIGILAGC